MVGAFIFAGTVYHIMTILHPIWFVVISLITIPIASWLGAKSGRVASPALTP